STGVLASSGYAALALGAGALVVIPAAVLAFAGPPSKSGTAHVAIEDRACPESSQPVAADYSRGRAAAPRQARTEPTPWEPEPAFSSWPPNPWRMADRT